MIVIKAESGIPPSPTDTDLGEGRKEGEKWFLQNPLSKPEHRERAFVHPSHAPHPHPDSYQIHSVTQYKIDQALYCCLSSLTF